MNLSEIWIWEKQSVYVHTIFWLGIEHFVSKPRFFTYQWKKRERERKYPQYYHLICIAFSDYLKFKFINSANIEKRTKKKVIGANARHIIPVGVETLKPLKIASMMETNWGRKIQYFLFFFIHSWYVLFFFYFFFSSSSILMFCHHVVFVLSS